jgi:HEAT repeat protein
MRNRTPAPAPVLNSQGFIRSSIFGLLAVLALTGFTARPALPQPGEVAGLVAQVAAYQPGDSTEPVRRMESLVRQAITNASIARRLAPELPKLLLPPATLPARRFACQQLAILPNPRALPALARLLKSPEDTGFACFALAAYPPGKADKILRIALSDSTGDARIQIIETLGDRRDRKAVALMIRLAKDSGLPEARAVVVALGKIGSPAAREALANLQAAGPPGLRPELLEARARMAEQLAKSGDRRGAMAIYQEQLAPSCPRSLRRGALMALIRLDEDGGEKRIGDTLEGSDPTLRTVALGAIRSLPAAAASARFARLLPQLSNEEQVLMLDSLAARGDAPARAAMISSLESRDAGVRRTAIMALGKIGDASSVPALAKALAISTDSDEQHALESSLRTLPGGEPTERVIIDTLNISRDETRARLISSLSGRGSPSVQAVLLAEAGSSNPAVAKAAFEALAAAGAEDQLPMLLDKFVSVRDPSLRSDVAVCVAQVVLSTENPAWRSASVLRVLRQPCDADTRCALLRLLPLCGDSASLALLNSALGDENAQVRDCAMRALADWPDLAAWGALLKFWQTPASNLQRTLALRALVRLLAESNSLSGDQLLDRYRELLRDAREDGEWRLILGSLSEVAQPGALDLALPLLDKPAIRAEVEAAVKKIAEAIQEKYPQAAKDAVEKLKSN